MYKPRLICVCGYAQVGKSTLCDILNKKYDYTVCSFAEILKKEVNRAMGAIGIHIDTFNNEEDKKKFRGTLVDVGTYRRSQNPDHWVNELFNSDAFKRNSNVAISDTRYLNEVTNCKKINDTIVVYISRPGYDGANETEKASVKEILNSNKIDFFIENNGTIKDLEIKLDCILNGMNNLCMKKY